MREKFSQFETSLVLRSWIVAKIVQISARAKRK